MNAVIFDMDGTLIDTKHIHLKAWDIVFKKKDIRVSKRRLNSFFGRYDVEVFREVFKEHNLPCDPVKCADERRKLTISMFEKGVKLYPGAKRLVNSIRCKKALGTSSSRQECRIFLKQTGLKFDAVLCKEDVKHHKPHPELYLRLARMLRTRPKECAAVEDSVAGVEAAKRAGMFCIARIGNFSAQKLHKADLRVRTLSSKAVRKVLCDCL